ncbi:MAG: RimK family alpha-L-glutamate ligase [Rhodospirillales bacterium]|nr:RimK family alpha-L-glutamate ligase [Alphaproteobacteria bacterium]MCB9987651.1 RimK family alpha-L-glutamate ligase [Rhodospirillales bacterium]USO08050.1 MAG: RimK family alpha-L-glutamate ligase [Rhodospirillales bacterium]
MKIWLFFHGPLQEGYPEAHEILRICDEAEKRGIDYAVLNPDLIDLLVDSKGEWSAIYEGKRLGLPDVIIPRTGTETTYTGYSVMRFYERLGVPFLNTPRIVETVADKLHTLQVLAAHGIPVPRTMLGKYPPDCDMIEREFGFPLVVKTLKGTRGGGVFLAETRDKFKDLIDLIAESGAQNHVIFQKYVNASHGRDLRVFIVGGKVHAVMERQSTSGSFKSNISRGGAGKPHPITPEIAKLALDVAHQLRLEVTGVDLLFDENGFTVCEANSSPGFSGLESSCNINAAGLILDAAIAKSGKKLPRMGNGLKAIGAAAGALWGRVFGRGKARTVAAPVRPVAPASAPQDLQGTPMDMAA